MNLISFLDNSDPHGQLMLAYARGDVQAFDTLYVHYRGPLFRYFLRQCGSHALAEELYQELWMKVINSRDRYEHSARFATWLYHIAHNLLVDHFRKLHPESGDLDPDEAEAGPDSDPAEQYSSQEKISRFLGLLQSLPDAQREVFLLKEEGGLSLEEIAKVTRTSFETVKSRLRYAVNKLLEAVIETAQNDEQIR